MHAFEPFRARPRLQKELRSFEIAGGGRYATLRISGVGELAHNAAVVRDLDQSGGHHGYGTFDFNYRGP